MRSMRRSAGTGSRRPWWRKSLALRSPLTPKIHPKRWPALSTLYSYAPHETATRRPLLLIGPPGAGKTFTIAKLAARHQSYCKGERPELAALITASGAEPVWARPAPTRLTHWRWRAASAILARHASSHVNIVERLGSVLGATGDPRLGLVEPGTRSGRGRRTQPIRALLALSPLGLGQPGHSCVGLCRSAAGRVPRAHRDRRRAPSLHGRVGLERNSAAFEPWNYGLPRPRRRKPSPPSSSRARCWRRPWRSCFWRKRLAAMIS
jgi:hypothetical protein